MKKQRGKRRRDRGVQFYADYEIMRYTLYWNNRYEAERQPFYRRLRRNREVERLIGKKAHAIIMRGERG